ncbi:Aste57867_11461 [Aphanomyces stellatus]|uniref:Aste57867_11461 protein n=1 Tax=Aphanomyces stellatus TaxID=120398 RepID=A0A485KT17_9STRA|nr:hypothetical protein As57867_011418 [Aphanomyces stellatus]VFT88322.1 Aste57867_11461 [Aphanomyces stellatus]
MNDNQTRHTAAGSQRLPPPPTAPCSLSSSSSPRAATTTPLAFRGHCLYPSSTCELERAVKKNGKPHSLCDFHRARHNQQQRKFDAKKKGRYAPYDMRAMEATVTTSAASHGAPSTTTTTEDAGSGVDAAKREQLRQLFWHRVHKPSMTLSKADQPEAQSLILATGPSSSPLATGNDNQLDDGRAPPPLPLPPLAELLKRHATTSRD